MTEIEKLLVNSGSVTPCPPSGSVTPCPPSWWSRARIVGDRQFVARQVDKRHAEDIVELEDGTCTWT